MPGMDTPATPTPIAPTEEERTWAMLCHLSALTGFFSVIGWFLGPFLLWQIKKAQFPGIAAHGRAAINFQLSVLLYAVGATLLILIAIGVPLLFALGLFNVICIVLAAIKANQGEPWTYPLTLRFLK